MKKNVLQLIGSFHQGGSERQAVQLSRLLRADGTVEVFAAALNREGVLLQEMIDAGFELIPEFRLASFYDLNFADQVLRCAKFMRDKRIDVVHTHDFYTNVFGMAAAAIARVPLCIASKRETGGVRSRMQDRVESLAFRKADRIVVNAEAVRDYLIGRGIGHGKINVIYNGLDLERLRPERTEPAAIRRELGLPEDSKVITLVANLRHRVKNQPMFIRAAAKVKSEDDRVLFVIAGEGELRDEIEKLAADLGVADSVRLLGRCPTVPDLLSISSAGVLTSFNEGFSNSILEYMAAGLPVIATRVGGAAEAIRDGESGFLIDSDDDQALAARIIELISDPEKSRRFGALAHEIVRERFSLSAQLEATLELYSI